MKEKFGIKTNQCRFQILLIQHRKYLSENESALTFNNLSAKQIKLLKDKTIDMTYKQAQDIFNAKNYKDPDMMRGRQSMNPLTKLGLIQIDKNKIIHLSNVGRKLYDGSITWDDFVLDSLLKYQLPNPTTEGFKDWNIKPFIAILHLIKRVNQLCVSYGLKSKGISTEEFGIFALSLNDYKNIDKVANDLLSYRKNFEKIHPANYKNNHEYEIASEEYMKNFIEKYLFDFNNPVKNAYEYGDSMIRYLRQTKYILFRGKYDRQYIDLEPCRMIEIDSILAVDNASNKTYTKEQWQKYMGTYGAYELPFETIDKLTKIYDSIIPDIRTLENKLGKKVKLFEKPNIKDKLKAIIKIMREYRIELKNLEIKFDYAYDTSKIEQTIKILSDLATNHKNDNMVSKPSIELEKWTNVALNIINDAESIKPNFPMGDDNEPTFTAPAGVSDIECNYGKFGVICEVTMLKGRDQWYNEGIPVMRHLRDYEDRFPNIPNYCLFIAPSIHEDTISTYWNALKYEFKGKKQRIVPITIKQLTYILSLVKQLRESRNNIYCENILDLYNRCIDVSKINNSTQWLDYIDEELEKWRSQLLQNL
ncbi:AlwI family type II restriction endonuclease [Helicobacter sp. 11S03491-1]|uniref:AlwI family type II restriction endonuclease n=1 Tax=Helicobacter sp. 11S03491-1 TaxID=1476196 RepID=UPI000BA51C49|nr:AlwI family type II restriction endonuclease [Helicobacter sp. 11S03491-1]